MLSFQRKKNIKRVYQRKTWIQEHSSLKQGRKDSYYLPKILK